MTAHIESVNAEYRQLEDYVYCLEDENAKLEARLAALQDNYNRVRAGQPPREGGLFRRRSESGGTELAPPRIDEGSTNPPEIEIPGAASSAPAIRGRSTLQRPKLEEPSETLDLGPPSIEIPEIPSTPAAPGSAPKTPATESLPLPSRPTNASPNVPELLPIKPADPQVTHIHLNPLMTGGADFDGQPGDEGLSVVIEPRNAADEFVPAAGAVSIVVLDPEKQGDAARVARWDYTLPATEQKLATATAARGIQLEMPWPASPPANNRLKLYVRYEGPDGRQLQSERDLYITPPGQVAQRWTPRSAERSRPRAIVPPAEAAAVANPEIIASAEPAVAVASDQRPTRPTAPPAELSEEPQLAQQPAAWSPHR
jgi:hypothetical protein